MKCVNHEILFAIDTNQANTEGEPYVVYVTPENYWIAEHLLYDQWIENPYLNNYFPELMECILEYNPNFPDKATVTAELLNQGFRQDASFSKFMGCTGGTLVSLAPSTPKLKSSYIKLEIIKYIANNPGCIKSLWETQDQASIDEVELQKAKVWKRCYKSAVDGGIERLFEATGSKQSAVAEQVKATVITDFTDTIIKSITFEG